MSSAALRMQRHRDRLAHGRRWVSAEFDEDDLLDTLVVGGMLDPAMADDPEAIRAGLVRQMQVLAWLARHNHPLLRILVFLTLPDDEV